MAHSALASSPSVSVRRKISEALVFHFPGFLKAPYSLWLPFLSAALCKGGRQPSAVKSAGKYHPHKTLAGKSFCDRLLRKIPISSCFNPSPSRICPLKGGFNPRRLLPAYSFRNHSLPQCRDNLLLDPKDRSRTTVCPSYAIEIPSHFINAISSKPPLMSPHSFHHAQISLPVCKFLCSQIMTTVKPSSLSHVSSRQWHFAIFSLLSSIFKITGICSSFALLIRNAIVAALGSVSDAQPRKMPHSISDRIHLQNTGTENGLQKQHIAFGAELTTSRNSSSSSSKRLTYAFSFSSPNCRLLRIQLSQHLGNLFLDCNGILWRRPYMFIRGQASHVFRAPSSRAHARALPLLHVHDHVLLSSLLRVLHFTVSTQSIRRSSLICSVSMESRISSTHSSFSPPT